MSSLEELREERDKKRLALMAGGHDPYPTTTGRTHENAVISADNEGFVSRAEVVTLAGRIMALRRHGGSAFADIFDGTEKMQIFLSEAAVGEDSYKLFDTTIDLGDFIEVTGALFVTKRGTYALGATNWRILTKALLAIPSEHFGIKDEDERYRKRYLDLLLTPEVRDIAYKRAKFWRAVRRFHEDRGFLEVHTPTLEITTGGGDARPFATHHNTLDIDVFLRISAGELWQKRLMVAGFPKTFEVGRIFRNEGMSAEHLQEYEQCEAYWAYANFEDMYRFLKECYQYVAQETFGTQQFSIRGFNVDLAGDWPLIDYASEVQKQTGVDIWSADEAAMKARLAELNVSYAGVDNRERLIDTLWKFCRKNIGGPAILVNEPTMLSPLAKKQADGRVVERFHFVIAGSEVGQGYSELNDPVDQRERFMVQQALRDAGDDEAQMADMEFVEALEYGMPPTAGHGFSERLFAFLLDKPIREVQLFPLMKPKAEIASKAKEKAVAVIVIDRNKLPEPWQVLNTVAHVTASFSARTGKKLLYAEDAITKDDKKIPLNIQYAIMIKEGSNLQDVFNNSPEGCEAFPFTRDMLETTNDKKVIEATKHKNDSELEYLGVLIFGPRSMVEDYTKDFPLSK